MKTIGFKLEGETLMMHNGRLANPLNKYQQRLKELHTEKKKKGVDALMVLGKMALVEWEGGLYHTETEAQNFKFEGPFIPGECVRACLVSGAKLTRGGATVKRTCFVTGNFPIEYDGPKTLAELKEVPEHMDQRMVKVGQAKVLRSRPVFYNWECRVEIGYDENACDVDDIIRWMTDAGNYIGMLEARDLGFGRFKATPLGAYARIAPENADGARVNGGNGAAATL